jgi:para-nitrobenzyl esterase
LRETAILVGDDAPQTLADIMHRAWLGFMKTGTPAAPGMPTWPAYTPAVRAMMRFNDTTEIVLDPYGSRLARWPSW